MEILCAIAVGFVTVPFIVGITLFFLKPMIVGCASGWMFLFSMLSWGRTKSWFARKTDHLATIAGKMNLGD